MDIGALVKDVIATAIDAESTMPTDWSNKVVVEAFVAKLATDILNIVYDAVPQTASGILPPNISGKMTPLDGAVFDGHLILALLSGLEPLVLKLIEGIISQYIPVVPPVVPPVPVA